MKLDAGKTGGEKDQKKGKRDQRAKQTDGLVIKGTRKHAGKSQAAVSKAGALLSRW